MVAMIQLVFPSSVDTPSDWFVELNFVRVCRSTYTNKCQGLGLNSRTIDGIITFWCRLPMETIGNQECASCLMPYTSSYGVMGHRGSLPGKMLRMRE